MTWDSAIDWSQIFRFDMPVLEIIARGSCVYLALFFMLRFVLKRQVGTLGITDILLITLIADASQNAMAGTYNTVPSGILLVATLVSWNYILEWLGFHNHAIERMINPGPLLLVHNGALLKQNMRRELITEDDLMSQLREGGVEKISDVKSAWIEGDGKISVIRKKA